MQRAEASLGPVTDIATKIAMTMRQMGVAGLPRNYELFYEAYTGSNQDLIADLVGLGTRVSQDRLDRIGAKHIGRGYGQEIVDDARDAIERKIEEIMLLLLKERRSLESYGKFLDETSSGISNRAVITRELLGKIVDVMATATDTTISHGRQVASSMADKSAELEAVKSKLAEYKRLADTDPLTEVWNRRAFDRALSRSFTGGRSALAAALVIIDIDDFKRVNDHFGHPVGDRIIRGVADILKANAPAGVVVARTGGEEFALIVEGSSEAAVMALADGVRDAVQRFAFADPQSGENCGPITVSMGVCMAAEATGPDDLYSKADRAMYSSKMSGRNRVTAHSTLAQGSFRKDWLLYRGE